MAYYLLLLFYYLLKPARDSLFLVELDAGQLPFAYMLTALVAAPVTAIYARAGLRHRLDRLVMLTTVVLLVQLVVLRWLIQIPQDWVFYLFYSWVGVAGGLVTSQFWLMANALFDAGQAKRLFPILGLGGIAGAFTGGEVTGLLINELGLATPDLLFFALLALAGAAACALAAWSRRGLEADAVQTQFVEEERSGSLGCILRSIVRSRHLSLTVGVIALTVMTTSFVDFQFKSVSLQSFPQESELTSFLGRFYGRTSLLSLLVQVLLATRLLRVFGTGGVLLFLPLVLMFGAGGLILAPGLTASMFLRGGDITLKYSLDKTSRELLFLPIPLALKKRTKVFIDMFVDRWARGLAGLLLLLCTAVLKLDLVGLGLVILGLLLIWLVLAVLARREYVNSFRTALSRRDIDLSGTHYHVDDATSRQVLVNALRSENPKETAYALDMLRSVVATPLTDEVRPLLDHDEASIRQKALQVLAANEAEIDPARTEALLRDENLEVRIAAVNVVLAAGSRGREPVGVLQEMLAASPRCRNAALAYIATVQDEAAYRDLVDRPVVEAILSVGGKEGREGRRVLAGLAWTPTGCNTELWDRLLQDDDPEVVAETVKGIGRRIDTSRADWLLERLGHATLRVHTREALAALAVGEPSMLNLLEQVFRDVGQPPRVRVEIPRVLAKVPTQRAVSILLKHLATHQPELRYEVLKALGKLRAHYRSLTFDTSLVSGEIAVEAGRYVQLARLSEMLPKHGPAAVLLTRTIGETQQLRLESVFRLLGLVYPARDVVNAYYGLFSGRRVLRANAQEFLDNILSGPHRSLVRSLIDDSSARTAWLEAGIDPGQPIRSTQEALDFLGASCDPWLAATAIYAGGNVDNPAAACHLRRRGDDMLNPIEKVLILQNVDVFTEVPTDQLAALAAIAREVSVLAGDRIYREHDPSDALYLVLSGRVRLHLGDETISEITRPTSFGTWALFDDEPRVMTATALEDTRLLRIDQGEFNDLLADDVRIAKGIIRTVGRRLRELAGRAT